MPTYKEIVKDPQYLAIEDQFIHDRKETIKIRLLDAADELQRSLNFGAQNEAYAFTHCRYLASSAVMLGASESNIRKTEQDIKNTFEFIQPSTIITFATLYYLIKKIIKDTETTAKDKDKLFMLCRRLTMINWGLSPEVVTDLGMTNMVLPTPTVSSAPSTDSSHPAQEPK